MLIFVEIVLVLNSLVTHIDGAIFLDPLLEAAIKDLDSLVAEYLEHPGGPIPPPLHTVRVVANDSVGEADTQSFHAVYELFF